MNQNKQAGIFFIILAIWTLSTGYESVFPGVLVELGNYKYLLATVYIGLAIFLFNRKYSEK